MPNKADCVLGIDLGVASIGWSLVRLGPISKGKKISTPCGVIAMGAHLFEAGVDCGKAGLDVIGRGQDTPLNTKRREARLMRRQVWRRARRKRKLLRVVISCGLLPALTDGEDALRTPESIDAYMKRLDGLVPRADRGDAPGMAQRWTRPGPIIERLASTNDPHELQLKWPYVLRSAAASHRVEPHEFGRALYHLAQRRGFLSNRRMDAKKQSDARGGSEGGGKKDDDTGKVKEGIRSLEAKIAAHSAAGGVPTLGGYFASIDPEQERIRRNYTHRAMYLAEFDAMWAEQAKHHAALLGVSPDGKSLREAIWLAIFHQRPLKSQSDLVGRCSLEPDQPRAPIAHRLYQRFRVLQTVNSIELAEGPDGTGEVRLLRAEERENLIRKLLQDGDITFGDAKKIMGFKRGAATLNLERGEAKKLIGHRTDAALREAIGQRLDALGEDERDLLVQDVRQFRVPAALARRGMARWGLDLQAAERLASVSLEEGRGSVSLAAIRKLLPLLKHGTTYGEARRKLYPESFRSVEPLDVLPPVESAIKELRNPAVARALTEARKLVNAIIREHGKPAAIRVELARELKNPRAIREKVTREMRDREQERAEARARIESIRSLGIKRPSRHDIDKALLWQECGGICPYTGQPIDFEELFGKSPRFDIEHIWPRSRCLDDGFANKTLCDVRFNRERKKNRIPHEIFGGQGSEYEAVLDRVKRFKGDFRVRQAKLKRFTAEEIDEKFRDRHLSETRYITRAAADYLALLYGGRYESAPDGAEVPGTRRVFTPTGGLTAWLRSGWGLNTILAKDAEPWEQAEKNREDHRHHAIDALVVALSDDRAVKILADAAKEAEAHHKRRAFERIEEPWRGFRDGVAKAVEAITVSHRQSRKVSGAMHQESVYSKAIQANGAGQPRGEHRIRKELAKLSPSEIAGDQIVDPRARDAIRDALAAKGKASPAPRDIAAIFGDPANLPLVTGHAGAMVRLRKVRIRTDPAVSIGRGAHARRVQTGANHHTVIYATKDKKGREVWLDEPVTLREAYRRVAAKEAIVRRDLGEGRTFVMSLAPGEFVEMDAPKGTAGARGVYRVSNLSEGDMELKYHRDARAADTIKQAKARVRVSGEKLRALDARKVCITYLGEVKPSGG
jgi:CRISPR-associated endonuclease Csn1